VSDGKSAQLGYTKTRECSAYSIQLAMVKAKRCKDMLSTTEKRERVLRQ